MVLSFIDLPLEMRDLVYDYVFEGISVDVYEAHSGRRTRPKKRLAFNQTKQPGKHFPPSYHPRDVLALLLVSSQISKEAGLRFYGNKTFAGTLAIMYSFLRGIGSRRLNIIRTIELISQLAINEIHEPFRLYDLLGTLQNLQKVYITVSKPENRYAIMDLTYLGINDLIGLVDIVINNTYEGDVIDPEINNGSPFVLTNESRWTCPKGEAVLKLEKSEQHILACYSYEHKFWFRGDHYDVSLLRSLGSNKRNRGSLPKGLMREVTTLGDLRPNPGSSDTKDDQ